MFYMKLYYKINHMVFCTFKSQQIKLYIKKNDLSSSPVVQGS